MMRSQNSPSEPGRPHRGRGLRRLLERFIGRPTEAEDPRRGRLLLESLEKRQLLAGDVEMLFTDGLSDFSQPAAETSSQQSGSQAEGEAEGEAAPDLVQFAKDLVAAGVEFYGAAWCPACTEQKQLFEDGGDHLNMIESSDPDKRVERLSDPSASILNEVGIAQGINSSPTWIFPDGTRAEGVQTLEDLSQRSGVAIPQSEQPTFDGVGDLNVQIGSPLHVPIDAYDPNGGPLTVTVTVDDPSLLTATVLQNNRSIRIDMQGYDDMVYELFEQRAPVAAGRVATLAESDFYDDIIFHRVTSNFVIQAGDPTGTGTSGSNLGQFDDDFHPDLQHNREGVMSFAKSTDDTNNSQFFVTETATRFLDFNHSVFGQLVEGFDVREAISQASTAESRFTGSSQKPDIDVTMTSIDVFTDDENSVVMLKPTGSGTGTTNVTFTVTDSDGNTHSETVEVTVSNDTANSQPFLTAAIAEQPPTVLINTPAQLQLSSVDVEGDAVTYFAQSLSGASNATVSVDSATGLVTVEPATGFSGTINVNVGVRPGPGVFGNSGSDQDTQRVAFTFEGEPAIAPSFVDLLAGSDSGNNDDDDLTNEGTLSFLVGGVTAGATVEIVNIENGAVIGTALASGGTVTVTTNNIAALGDGTYQLAARQTIDGDTSDLSPSLTLQYDSVAPDAVTGSALTQANANRPFITDLISNEEGQGLTYVLTTAPTGATIAAETGIIEWTPTSGQIGQNSFVLELIDAAGNTRSESFDVNVAGEPLAEIRLDLRGLDGNPIDSLAVGDEFFLDIVAEDARFAGTPGVFAAYADILFDSQFVQPVSGATIEYNDQFTLVRKGQLLTGLIDEVGAVNSSLSATQRSEDLIATIRMEALATGTVTIRSEPADEVDSEFLIYGEDDQVPAESIAFGGATLTIGQSFLVTDDAVTVAEDSGQTDIDVLANDQILSNSTTLSVVSVTQPSEGGTVTRDGDIVRFTPAANFNGTTTFTYLAGDNNGVQSSGTVTVTVTPVNDAPTANADSFDVVIDSTDNLLDVLANDTSDPDASETLSVTAVGEASNGGTVEIASNGTGVLYTPATGFTGSETFTYTVSDGDLTQTAIATVTVAPADDPPSAVDDTFDNLTEDDPETELDVLSNDLPDVNNETFVVHSVGMPDQGGSVRISDDASQVLYTPAANFNGTETFSYTIRDEGGGLSVAMVMVTVAAVNDPPPIDSPTVNLNRATGPTIVFSLDDLPLNVDDAENLSISDFESSTSAGGTVQLINGESLQYTLPSSDFVGSDSFTYQVSDEVNQSTGTISLNVTDFAPRDVVLNVPERAVRSRVNGLRIVGTNQLGESVDQPVEYSDDKAVFEDLLPGDYTIEVPAIPFLQNGDEPRQIPFTSSPDDGDASIDSELGSLKAEFISIRDWLGSASNNSVLLVIKPGSTPDLTVPNSGFDDSEMPVVELDGNSNSVTIRRTVEVEENGETVNRAEVATLPLESGGAVEVRGVIAEQRLLKIDFNALQFSEDTAGDGGNGGEGEAIEPIVISVGGTQAEGESIPAAVQSNVMPASSSSPALRTDATVLLTEEGDLWFAEDVEQPVEPVDATQPQAVDSAMQDVSESLMITNSAGDELADDGKLHQSAIDQVLGSEL